MPKRNLLKKILFLFKGSVAGFVDDKVMKLSAALAYYTVFSIGPMLMVIIMLCSIFYGKEAIEGTIYSEISTFVGSKAALQIQEIIRNAAISDNSTLAAIIGIGTLLFGATGVFVEIQDSINFIWGLKAKPQKGWLKMLLNRLLSFSLVIGLGFVLLVSLVVDSLIEFLNEKLLAMFPEAAVIWAYTINTALNFVITALLFGIIFKVLPDARIKWKDVGVGACFTALLFLLGKMAIGYYMGQVDTASSYGVAGSLVVVLLWVYYSAAILYFGAEFTLQYAQEYGKHIYPDTYAVWIEKVEVQHKESLEKVKKVRGPAAKSSP
ncbi:membrane protein [Anseongella ginsenosidimutans]|uniref:Membrane protein n=1 Tax=Anseongella ginsenosidimutans TaxID=496056 RepID=A0A4R3KZP8_9SPHI|nr:YihY/virulence factor BrkB family protein [Anseongella ginsenosidimutans]QEC51216.1 YihY/virulence factor BrkB family protein [Anseongella ginsenosidimutans]TCS90110.1 membrane protein [Anseongella ginsenosidimutans]